MIVGSFSKIAEAKESFSVDFADKLDEGDTLASRTVDVPSGITLINDAIIGTKVAAAVSGGTAGAEYILTVKVTTATGLEFESEVLLSVLGLQLFVDTLAEIDETDLYHARRGNTDWLSADLGAREAALRKGTAYLEARYAGQWLGIVADDEQLLSWPRARVRLNGALLDDDIVPTLVKQAVMEAALREVRNPGTLLPDLTSDTQITSEKVGPIETSYAAARRETPVIQVVDSLLAPYLLSAPTTGVNFLMRA